MSSPEGIVKIVDIRLVSNYEWDRKVRIRHKTFLFRGMSSQVGIVKIVDIRSNTKCDFITNSKESNFTVICKLSDTFLRITFF